MIKKKQLANDIDLLNKAIHKMFLNIDEIKNETFLELKKTKHTTDISEKALISLLRYLKLEVHLKEDDTFEIFPIPVATPKSKGKVTKAKK